MPKKRTGTPPPPPKTAFMKTLSAHRKTLNKLRKGK